MKYPKHITFEQLDDGVHYQVTDSKNNRHFCGELNETLDFWNSWCKGEEPYDDVEYFVDMDNIEFECEFDLDDYED